MIDRYTRPEFRALWSDENRFRCWLEVEATASEVLADAGIVPHEAARAIRERGAFTVERIREIEKETRHDVIAFTTAVAEKVGPESRWLHFGLTSTDVVDTAQALQIREASRLILEGLNALAAVLRRRAVEFALTPTIGRTHGVHAEPTTFGLKQHFNIRLRTTERCSIPRDVSTLRHTLLHRHLNIHRITTRTSRFNPSICRGA